MKFYFTILGSLLQIPLHSHVPREALQQHLDPAKYSIYKTHSLQSQSITNSGLGFITIPPIIHSIILIPSLQIRSDHSMGSNFTKKIEYGFYCFDCFLMIYFTILGSLLQIPLHSHVPREALQQHLDPAKYSIYKTQLTESKYYKFRSGIYYHPTHYTLNYSDTKPPNSERSFNGIKLYQKNRIWFLLF